MIPLLRIFENVVAPACRFFFKALAPKKPPTKSAATAMGRRTATTIQPEESAMQSSTLRWAASKSLAHRFRTFFVKSCRSSEIEKREFSPLQKEKDFGSYRDFESYQDKVA